MISVSFRLRESESENKTHKLDIVAGLCLNKQRKRKEDDGDGERKANEVNNATR